MPILVPTHPRLQTASRVVLAVAVIAVLWRAGVIAKAAIDDRYWSFADQMTIAAVATAYFYAAVHLRRGSYSAVLLLIILSATELVGQLFQLSIHRQVVMFGEWLWLGPFVQAVASLAVLLTGLWARPIVLANYPNQPAVDRARRRGIVGLRIAYVILILQALGALVSLYWIVPETNRGADRWITLIFIVFAVVWFAGAGLYMRQVRRLRAGSGPSILGLVFGIAIGAVAALLLLGFSLWLVMALSWALDQEEFIREGVGLICYAGPVWLLVDVLHARRVSVEPPSYGFAPIMASPVQTIPTPPENA